MNGRGTPDGIEQRHIRAARGAVLRAPLGLVSFGLLLAAAAFGVFGARTTVTGDADGVRLSVEGPSRIRSGEYFEMLFTVETQREIRDAVLSVDNLVWHDVTINTMIPQPAEQDFNGGAFEFHFGALTPGSHLLVKVDGQINPVYPPGLNRGAIAIVDGSAALARVDYSMRVLP